MQSMQSMKKSIEAAAELVVILMVGSARIRFKAKSFFQIGFGLHWLEFERKGLSTSWGGESVRLKFEPEASSL